jgi:hypothetical protein
LAPEKLQRMIPMRDATIPIMRAVEVPEIGLPMADGGAFLTAVVAVAAFNFPAVPELDAPIPAADAPVPNNEAHRLAPRGAGTATGFAVDAPRAVSEVFTASEAVDKGRL